MGGASPAAWAPLQVPRMTTESRCNAEAWTNLNGCVSMDRTSLMQTIKAHYLTGQLTSDQLGYLNTLKDSTISIWAAANELLPKAHLLPQDGICETAFESTVRNWNVPQLIQQVTQWARIDRNLINADLLENLSQLTQWKNGEGECPNPNTVLKNLDATLGNIEGYLNQLLQADFQVEDETRTIYGGADITHILTPEMDNEFWFIASAANLCGVELSANLSPITIAGGPGLKPEYWSALLSGLHNVSRLVPLFTPVDMAENPFLEEINDDLVTIQEAMESAGMDATDMNQVEDAIAQLAEAHEIFIIEDAEMYEYHKRESDDAAESVAQWSDWNNQIDLPTTLKNLPAPLTENEKKLAAWLADVEKAMQEHVDSDNTGAETPAIHISPVHIACEGDEFAYEYMDSEHRMIMEGRCDDDQDPIEFGISPSAIISEFKKINAGLRLIARLIEEF